jgi:hypothetical protein
MIFVTPVPCSTKAIDILSSLTHLNTNNNINNNNISHINSHLSNSSNDNIKSKKLKIMNQIDNGLKLTLQQNHVDTILKWNIINKKKILIQTLVYIVKISIVNEGEIEWKEIYIGSGNACHISGLLSNVIYQCNVKAYKSKYIKKDYKKENIIASDIFFQLKDKVYIKL